jgi:hypothetical protein
MSLTKNIVFHERYKLIVLKLHLSRHLQRDGRMVIHFIAEHLVILARQITSSELL